MVPELPGPASGPDRGAAAYLTRLLAGPTVFLLVLALPLALSYEGRVSLATFACAVVWWMTQPMPWAVAAMLPFVVFPIAGVMDVAATMRLYGQPIFFWIMGTVLMGYAIEKHGLAHRFALAFLALPGVGSRTSRLLFAYMLMVGLLSMFVSDASTVAMTIPIGMSIVRHVQTMRGGTPSGKTNLGAFVTLGTFYGAVAGGTATLMGLPHNAVAASIVERFTGGQVGFFRWMTAGVPVFVGLLLAFYATLRVLTPPELNDLPGGEAFIRGERAKLGPLRPNERRVLFVFAAMVGLFLLPTAIALTLGGDHAVARWADRALSIWVVPPAVMFLLFAIPASDERGAGLLTWADAERHAPWGAMLLVTGAVAMADALTEFGFVELVGDGVGRLGIGPLGLPYLAAGLVALTTNLISGTAAAVLYCSIFVPAAAQTGYNPASIAILIANVAIGLVFPWAGATSATAFAAGEIDLSRMMRIGAAATVIFSMLAATIHLALAKLI